MKAIRLLFSTALSLAAVPAMANVAVGQPAPDFSATDSHGYTQTLSQYKGKTVVLEWNNPGCPFVQKHYSSGNIPKQQADAVKDGVVWLTINSGADGKQGHLDTKGAQEFLTQYHAAPTAYLFDGDGKIGHAYGAKTTPHLYVIDGSGTLRYMGGIDSIASADKEDLAKATQYVPQVLAELKAGKAVSVPTSEPYGCSVKYAP
ncbi:redoxin domain-containing protein [Dokdonella sp.]|uniref:redoxin domain-containing protein n=1 Tax=Dokdonella sp. TaxID=2291710 RepID=UPI001B272900|nr:redoxin domain-containing protein [Dokdonella sp.]MBO9661498.1 redoxin domain-containing protein [Dokdonella sp.]